jgi:CheY-like chemotaxis protein
LLRKIEQRAVAAAPARFLGAFQSMTHNRPRPERRSPGEAAAAESDWAVVADDDDDSRALLIAVLRRDGFEASEARDGNELVECFEALRREGHDAQFVVSDISMPECDGVQAARRLRGFSLTLPIILVTGSMDPDVWQAAAQAGADIVLQKPITACMLTRAVKSVMGT